MTSTQRAVSHDAQPTSNATAKRQAHKRGDGEGSINRVRDGLWRGRLMVGYKADGKPDRRTVYGRTREEVQDKVAALRGTAKQGMLGDVAANRVTVAAFLAKWLEIAKADVRVTTWRRYDDLVRLHISPALGKHKLTALRPADVQRLYAQKRTGEAALAPRTIRQIHAVLHRALKQALIWGDVPRNVLDAVVAPKFPRFELTPPTAEEVSQLLDAAGDDRLVALWTVAVYSGCREGELLGLRWKDLDLDAGTLSVQQTLTAVGGAAPLFGEPKTAGSRRVIALPPEAVDALRQHRQRQLAERMLLGGDYAKYGLVFADPIGNPLRARNLIRAFKTALRRAGLPETIRFHDLRHAHATVLRRAGVDIKTVSERLGHSTIGITADLYTHGVKGADIDAAARMQQLVRGRAVAQ